jgi:hypothetical protein
MFFLARKFEKFEKKSFVVFVFCSMAVEIIFPIIYYLVLVLLFSFKPSDVADAGIVCCAASGCCAIRRRRDSAPLSASSSWRRRRRCCSCGPTKRRPTTRIQKRRWGHLPDTTDSNRQLPLQREMSPAGLRCNAFSRTSSACT